MKNLFIKNDYKLGIIAVLSLIIQGVDNL